MKKEQIQAEAKKYSSDLTEQWDFIVGAEWMQSQQPDVREVLTELASRLRKLSKISSHTEYSMGLERGVMECFIFLSTLPEQPKEDNTNG
jgi:hypothetical protein